MAYLTRQTQEDSDRNSTWGMLPMSCSCRAYDFTTRLIWEREACWTEASAPRSRDAGWLSSPLNSAEETARFTSPSCGRGGLRASHLRRSQTDHNAARTWAQLGVICPLFDGGGGREATCVLLSPPCFCSCRHGGTVWFSHLGFKFGTSETWVHR